MSEERDPAWDEAMSQPVTRWELIQAMQTIQAVLLSHGAHDAARMTGDAEKIRESGAKAIEHTMAIGTLAREFISRWTGGDVGQ